MWMLPSISLFFPVILPATPVELSSDRERDSHISGLNKKQLINRLLAVSSLRRAGNSDELLFPDKEMW
jgi:hypothetical protein